MTRESLESLARDFAKDLPLVAEEWAAILLQAERMRQAIKMLDELPLESVEPAAIFRSVP